MFISWLGSFCCLKFLNGLVCLPTDYRNILFFFYSVGTDGRVFVWKISEGPDDEDKPQITANIVIAVQIVGEEKVEHPQICWHCHKQVIVPHYLVLLF